MEGSVEVRNLKLCSNRHIIRDYISGKLSTTMLAGLISSPATSFITEEGKARRYRADFTSSVDMLGRKDTNTKNIKYEIGMRNQSTKDDLRKAGDDVCAPDMSIPTNFVHSADMSGYAKKYTNFSGIWDIMDLSGMVERLAKAVAAQSVHGGVTTHDMRAGQHVNVISLAYTVNPVMSSPSTVFIPRLVDSLRSSDVFSVMAAAANGEGSMVATDLVSLDSNTNSPQVPEVSGLELAEACVEALRILGANYSQNGAGEAFAYALTKGIHSVVSVAAHTDEGGYMRKVFRSGCFRAPYGGINYSMRDYTGLPALGAKSDLAVAGWVDAIALGTAALVAHCDPLAMLNGFEYPSVFTTFDRRFDEAGANAKSDRDEDALHLAREIASDASRFSCLYIRGLAKMFGLAHGPTQVAEVHMESCFTLAAKSVDRHLKHRAVAPYYWIEPTSIIPAGYLDSRAEQLGLASLCTRGRDMTVPGFEEVSVRPGGSTDVGSYYVVMPNARSSGLVVHLNDHPLNGLGALRVRQMDAEGVIFPGFRSGGAPEVLGRLRNSEPISSYLWKRGQSCLPAPSEFLNTGRTLGLTAVHMKWDEDYFVCEPEHLPSPHEMADCKVTYRVSCPRGITQGKVGEEDVARSFARTKAGTALSQARKRSGFYLSAHLEDMQVSFAAPVMPEQQKVYLGGKTLAEERGGVELAEYREKHFTMGDVKQGVSGVEEKLVRGAPVAVQTLMGPDHGPKAKQGVAGRGGGTSAAAPSGAAVEIHEDPTRAGATRPDPERSSAT